MSPTPRAKRPRADHRVGVPPAALDVELGDDGAEAPLEPDPVDDSVHLDATEDAIEARVAVVDTASLRFVGQPGSRIAGRAGDALEALPSPDDGVDTPALGRGDLVILAVPYDTRERVVEELARLLPALRRV